MANKHNGFFTHKKLPKWMQHDVVKTLLVLLAATILSIVLHRFFISFDNVSMIVIYILAVVFVSRITTGYFWGICASIAGVIGVNFFFTFPYSTLDFTRAGYPITFISMLLVSLITSAMTAQITKQARQSALRELRTEKLYEISKQLLVTRGLDNIIHLTLDCLYDIFHRPIIFYTDDPQRGCSGKIIGASPNQELILQSSNERFAVHWVFVNNQYAGTGTDVCTKAYGLYVPVVSQKQVLGVVGLLYDDGTVPEPDQMTFLDMMASQIAMALERQHLSDKQRKILVESEKEKMRSNLLRAISHDLRTPLTSILGASSAILENKDQLDAQTHDKLIDDIREDSQWLIRMVENLLSVTRISEGDATVRKSPEAAEEIVADAIARVKSRFPKQTVQVRVPDEFLLVPMDATLIEQVIINLLENAIKHSGKDAPIELTVTREENFAVFEVRDHGKGISQADIPYLFEGYEVRGQRSSDSSRGMGIGLSICNSIVRAHGGKITVTNKQSGGASFTFTLPIDEGVKP